MSAVLVIGAFACGGTGLVRMGLGRIDFAGWLLAGVVLFVLAIAWGALQ